MRKWMLILMFLLRVKSNLFQAIDHCYQLCSKIKLHVKQAIAEDVKQTKVLAYITALKKLCNYLKGCHLVLER
ncbi:hypothetical protein L1987_06015 [Smallanthus sonchifolius]|uniref:Uncharacterized protein n=1 Tax=Smallanthus sonchifolius TaxID=185202 RepID=A0ACB9JX39_9ASTR|nr:hypothetical protein L1987_06015 [Smallanthus sonchifolius]